jgi:hypothetical protein
MAALQPASGGRRNCCADARHKRFAGRRAIAIAGRMCARLVYWRVWPRHHFGSCNLSQSVRGFTPSRCIGNRSRRGSVPTRVSIAWGRVLTTWKRRRTLRGRLSGAGKRTMRAGFATRICTAGPGIAEDPASRAYGVPHGALDGMPNGMPHGMHRIAACSGQPGKSKYRLWRPAGRTPRLADNQAAHL